MLKLEAYMLLMQKKCQSIDIEHHVDCTMVYPESIARGKRIVIAARHYRATRLDAMIAVHERKQIEENVYYLHSQYMYMKYLCGHYCIL